MDSLKKQIQDEVSRVLMSFDDGEDEGEVTSRRTLAESFDKDEESDDEEGWGPNGNPFEEEAALVWGDGEGKESSIELIPENMEAGHKYYFEWNGSRMYAQLKNVGTDKFEIGIFQAESE